jgi:hypothetical protein
VTIADFVGAKEHGVRFSSGDTGRALHALDEIAELIESGHFSLPPAQSFALAETASASTVTSAASSCCSSVDPPAFPGATVPPRTAPSTAQTGVLLCGFEEFQVLCCV